MLSLSIGFLMVALAAAFVGFGSVASVGSVAFYTIAAAQIIFFAFMALSIMAFLAGTFYKREKAHV